MLIRADDREVFCFHWIKNKNPDDIKVVLGFTRALFGLVQVSRALFRLARNIEAALQALRERYPWELQDREREMLIRRPRGSLEDAHLRNF